MLLTTIDRAASFSSSVRGAARSVLACLLLIVLPGLAAAQERLSVEVQRHADYGRIILTFDDRMSLPEYRVASENGVLVIGFDTVFTGFLPDIGLALGDFVGVARLDPDMRGIRMGLRGPAQISTLEAGEQLFIDLLPPGWVGLPPGLPPETVARLAQRAEEAARIAEERRRAEMVAEYNPVATVRVGRHPTFSRVVFDWNVGTKAEYRADGERAEIGFDWPVAIDLYEVLSDMPPEILGVSNTLTPGGSVVAFDVAEGTGLRFYEETSTRFILDIDFPDRSEPDLDFAAAADAGAGIAATAEDIAPAPGEDAEPAAVSAAPAQAELTPFVMTVDATVRVVFPFEEETAAAVFKRGDTVWMLFDTGVAINAPPPGSDMALETLFGDFTVDGGGGAQVVRMTLNQARLATLGSEGHAWVLSLGDVLLSATEPVLLDRRQSPAGLDEVFADLVRPARVHHVRDPEVGDILDVVTAFPPARGIVRDLEYVDFTAPRSIHGLVVRPLRDDVAVRIEDRLAVIGSDTGLTLSPAQELRFRVPPQNRASAMDLGVHLAINPDDFQMRRADIVRRTGTVEGRELDRARLDLARFYLGNKLAHEALGVLAVLRADLRQADLEPAILATLGAANAVAGRPAEAIAILDADILRDEADAMIWRTIARSAAGDHERARLDALGAEAVIDDYPNWVRARFHLAAIRSALERDDSATAGRFLSAVDLTALDPDQISTYEVLGGLHDERNGRYAEALESYGRAIVADRRPTTAEAAMRTIALLDRLGRLDAARALDTVAVQSVLWRGDAIEMGLLRQLTDLQYRNGRYREAFATTREAALIYEETEVLTGLVDRARLEFASLYLDGGADALAPVEALGIYYDFRQLTPPGAQGDLMIRNLAQRLVKVDLLAQAADLLAYQVDNRLQGAARAQVAADLAVVHIANRDPNSALQVLHRTRLAGLPPALERQRRVLEARALIDAQRQDLALDLLSSVSGRDSELLRIEALWTGQRYREAGERIELLYAPDLERGALSPVARMNIVKAGVGYVLAGDQIGLSRLRSRYADAMASTPEWPMFAFVTATVEGSGHEFREIARQIAALDSLNAFLNAYREIYTAESALTPFRAARQAGV